MLYQPDTRRHERGLNTYEGTVRLMEANRFESINEENVSLRQNQVKHRIDVEKSRKHEEASRLTSAESFPSHLMPHGLAGVSSHVEQGCLRPVGLLLQPCFPPI